MKSKKEKFKEADLIVIPKGLAERCANCSFLDKKSDLCKHPKLLTVISDPANMCCAFWDNPSIDRKKTQG